MKFTGDLKGMGLEQSHADPYVFREFVARQLVAILVTILVVYVDNFLAFTTTPEVIKSLVRDLRSRYKIRDLDKALHGLPHCLQPG